MELSEKLKHFYMNMAHNFSSLSKDPKIKVGGVLLTTDGILYPGYNGDEIGGSNVRDSLSSGQSGFVHAEANILTKYNPVIHEDSKLFLTHSPCVVCSRMIINAKTISEVYYTNPYVDEKRSVKILEDKGVKVERIC